MQRMLDDIAASANGADVLSLAQVCG